MIYFYSEQIALAKRLIDAKGTHDDIKAAKDLADIDSMLNNVQPTLQFINAAKQLNRRINLDYPEIGEMHKIASGISNMLGMQTEQFRSEFDAILEKLNSDRFGIYISVLLKHGKVSCIKDVIERVD